MMTQCWELTCAVRSTYVLFFEFYSIFSASAVLVSTQPEKLIQNEFMQWYSVLFVHCSLLQMGDMTVYFLLISMERLLTAYENDF